MFRTALASSGKLLWRASHATPRSWAITIAVAVSAVVGAVPEIANAKGQPQSTPATVELARLPAQVQQTHQLILNGGPFPYPKDGIVFGNRERQLPKKVRGYYREYTVKTPGSRDRGARRIVCGGEPPTRPEVCYYTADHYATFSRIAP